jgi:hypothetical protein
LLTLPNLRTLAVFAYVNLDHFLSFIERSSCQLADIRLDFTEHSKFKLDKWSPALRSANRVEIMSYKDPNDVLEWVTWGPDMAFPFLMELVVETYEPNLDYTLLIDFLHSRRGTSKPEQLQSCRLKFHHAAQRRWQPGGVIAAELRKLMNEGLKFTIHVGYPEVCWP